MGKLIFSSTTSLDAYVNDAAGNFDRTAPDEEVHAFVNDLLRPAGTYLFGRRMYETMAYWETADPEADRSPAMRDFRSIWQAAEKVVYSNSLAQPTTERTRLEKAFVPSAVEALKGASERDLSIGGPTLAAHAFSAGLVDEIHLFVYPVIIGGGDAGPRGRHHRKTRAAGRAPLHRRGGVPPLRPTGELSATRDRCWATGSAPPLSRGPRPAAASPARTSPRWGSARRPSAGCDAGGTAAVRASPGTPAGA